LREGTAASESRGRSARILSLLESLTQADGISGYESQVRGIMQAELEQLTGDVSVDSAGNLIATWKPGSGSPSVALFAHMDEVGLLVKQVRPDGYLSFELSGGIDPSILPSQWVRVATSKGILTGIIGTAPGHLAGREPLNVDYRRMYIDVGARSQSEARDLGVRVGDAVTYDRKLTRAGDGRFVVSKALDNRIGCSVMIEAFRAGVESRVPLTLSAVGTTMEETGALGARAAAAALRPDVAIILDGLPAHDPLVPEGISTCRVGAGPVISRVEGRSPNSSVVPEWLMDIAVEAAEEDAIPYQIDVNYYFDSDAGGINFVAPGTPIVSIYVPRQNSHSPAEIALIEDIENAVRLASSVIKKLSSSVGIEKLKRRAR
jgi:putative aminopeptidase FrvX